MRRSASEIIRNLERRIARLETRNASSASTRNASDFDPRKAVVYFDLTLDEDSALKDGVDESSILDMERKAVKSLEKSLKVRISNEGHDYHGDLICSFALKSLEHAEKLMETIARNAESGHDTLDAGVEHFYAQNFLFYPQGVNGNSYSIDGEGDADGDLFAYLEYQGVI